MDRDSGEEQDAEEEERCRERDRIERARDEAQAVLPERRDERDESHEEPHRSVVLAEAPAIDEHEDRDEQRGRGGDRRRLLQRGQLERDEIGGARHACARTCRERRPRAAAMTDASATLYP